MIADEKIQMITDLILHKSFKELFKKAFMKEHICDHLQKNEFYTKSVIICV
ncbi:MAG: hypothetical protein H8D54_00170 [Candidatus Omnitrophica bacterium]|nr:hypothetical protein [Candidatus Omnitrophota bacterium]